MSHLALLIKVLEAKRAHLRWFKRTIFRMSYPPWDILMPHPNLKGR